METKVCTKCRLEKPTSQFNKCSSKKDGLQSECKQCHNILYLSYYTANKNKFRTNSSNRRNNIRLFLNEIKSKGCSMCGENDLACLDFHHIRDKEHTVSQLIKTENFTKIKAEVEKCIVLCANCHRKLHYRNLK